MSFAKQSFDTIIEHAHGINDAEQNALQEEIQEHAKNHRTNDATIIGAVPDHDTKHPNIHGIDHFQNCRDKYTNDHESHVAIFEGAAEVFVDIVIPKCDKETSDDDCE